MSKELLPLFPLQVVLFPDSLLPLHIFEERYKQLINECWDERREFGINLVQHSEMAKVGCTAEVREVVKKYNDGKMDILVRGSRRYLLANLVMSSSQYSVGRINVLKDQHEVPDTALAMDTIRLHNELVRIVYRDDAFTIEWDERNPILSFRIAQKAGMELAHRQEVLEQNSENQRLALLHKYFVEVIPRLERLGEVERIIKSDGYRIN
ncbi:MAG: LON peptidase substrate-binding domain-containing protein [Bacteroidetes bacterium]|nr:LON peptidase substrate-binding domain-containing protein [Bacteroidota bacterium]MCW5897272.1 LON peptidase substrate-binding domain-containing protein [Bacteroidota bacterium]